MKLKLYRLPFFLFSSVILAVLCAAVFGPLPFMEYIFNQVGGIFFDLLKMLVVPFAFISVTSAVIKMGVKRIRKLSYRFILLTLCMCLIGFALGFAMMSCFTIPPFEVQNVSVKPVEAPTVLQFIRNCIPVNPFNSLVTGNMLQVLVLSFVVGFGVLQLKDYEKVSYGFVEAQEICVHIVNFVMYLAPVGVFCLLYPVISRSFSTVVTAYFQMIFVIITGSFLYMVFVCIPLLFLFRINRPLKFFRIILIHDFIGAVAAGATNYMGPRIENLKKNSDLNPDIIDFFIPLTAVLIRIGSTICVGMYTVFAASIFHVELSGYQMVLAAFLTVICLMCAPGIIGGTLMDCAILWTAIGIPVEAVAFIAAIDYVIDLLRTVLNVQGGEIITACMNHYSHSLDFQER